MPAVAAAAPGSRLNLLLTDGEQLVATTWTHSLKVAGPPDSVTVSSEPLGRRRRWDDITRTASLRARASPPTHAATGTPPEGHV